MRDKHFIEGYIAGIIVVMVVVCTTIFIKTAGM